MEEIRSEKVIGSGQGFLIFLHLAQKSKILKSHDAKKPHQEVMSILEGVGSKKVKIEDAITKFNEQVAYVNEHIDPRVRYPIVMVNNERDFLRNEVVAFEMFLNCAMNAKLLSFEKETELFNKAIAVWEDVGHIKQELSIKAFIRTVKQANALLPEEHQYPVPEVDHFPKLAEEDDLEAVAPHVERVKATAPGVAKDSNE